MNVSNARVWFFVFALAAALAAGCTASVDADKSKLGPRPVGCDPGGPGVPAQTVSCICGNRQASMQTCNAYGRYDPCQCSALSLGAAGVSGM